MEFPFNKLLYLDPLFSFTERQTEQELDSASSEFMRRLMPQSVPISLQIVVWGDEWKNHVSVGMYVPGNTGIVIHLSTIFLFANHVSNVISRGLMWAL